MITEPDGRLRTTAATADPPDLVAVVRAGATFINGYLVERCCSVRSQG